MTSTRKRAARAAVLAVSATALIGLSSTPASAAGSTCVVGPGRPNGVVTNLLAPILGQPGYPTTPLGDVPFAITGTLDQVICQLLP